MIWRILFSLTLAVATGMVSSRERQPQAAKVAVQAGAAGCHVDLDASTAGSTDAGGSLVISNVEPGDHYIHVGCPGVAEAAFFISPKANEQVRIAPAQRPQPASSDPVTLAENQAKLRRLVQQAIQLRQQARLDESVSALREAMKLDPENSDLHRELGITFLLAKEWKRARVEMIEAIRHDQTDADAHNGLGYALEKLGDIDGALNEYRLATHLEPDDASYRTHYLDVLVRTQARKEIKK